MTVGAAIKLPQGVLLGVDSSMDAGQHRSRSADKLYTSDDTAIIFAGDEPICTELYRWLSNDVLPTDLLSAAYTLADVLYRARLDFYKKGMAEVILASAYDIYVITSHREVLHPSDKIVAIGAGHAWVEGYLDGVTTASEHDWERYAEFAFRIAQRRCPYVCEPFTWKWLRK